MWCIVLIIFLVDYAEEKIKIKNKIECALHYALLEHGELPCVLPFDVHLDLGHLPDTQGYLGLLPEPCNPTQGFKKL